MNISRLKINMAIVALFSTLVMTGGALAASSTEAASFYKGKNIRWIVPYSTGGGYDKYSRLISPFFAKYTGANIRIENKPGAGGMLGVNLLFKSPKDGLTVGIINGSAMVTNQIAKTAGASYKIEEFEFLGRIVADRRVLSVPVKNGFKSFEEMRTTKQEFKFGATGLGGSTYVDAIVMKEVFNLKQDLIHGFDSSKLIRQSMLRGDVAGMWGSLGSSLKSVKSGANTVILQSGDGRSKEFPDAPTVMETLGKLNPSQRTLDIVEAWQGLGEVGRPVAAPPGVPADRVKFLRAAFEQALNDPEFLAKAKKSKRKLNFASGKEMDQIAGNASSMSEEVRSFLEKAVKGEL